MFRNCAVVLDGDRLQTGGVLDVNWHPSLSTSTCVTRKTCIVFFQRILLLQEHYLELGLEAANKVWSVVDLQTCIAGDFPFSTAS